MRKFKQGGFTLIELMVVLAIIAIIAAIGYPSYIQYMVRAKRSAAESFMVTVANRQEQSMLNARQYFAVPTGASAEWDAVKMSVPTDVAPNYTITVAADNTATPPTFKITATPQGSQANGDAKCGNLSYDQAGAKDKSGTSTVADCWK